MPENSVSSHQAHTVDVLERDAGQRIDNFLMRILKGVPKSRIYRMLRSGEVRINGSRSKPADRVQSGDRIRVPPVRTAERLEAMASANMIDAIEDAILLEDEQLIVFNKPSGIAVHGGSGLAVGLIEALRQARPYAPMLELVHRLDRSASGCLVVAKTRETLTELHTLLKTGGANKRYQVLVRGCWREKIRKVDVPLARMPGASSRSVVSDQGKPSLSIFRPLSAWSQASLVEVEIHTGRMHQIRAHAAHIGRPVAGDAQYGDFEFNRQMQALGLKRLFLHAKSLNFLVRSRRYEVEAPLEPALQNVLVRIAQN